MSMMGGTCKFLDLHGPEAMDVVGQGLCLVLSIALVPASRMVARHMEMVNSYLLSAMSLN